jgi:hypothetical protein
VLSSELLSYRGRDPARPYPRHSTCFPFWMERYYLLPSGFFTLAGFVPRRVLRTCVDQGWCRLPRGSAHQQEVDQHIKHNDQPLPVRQCMACDLCEPSSSGQFQKLVFCHYSTPHVLVPPTVITTLCTLLSIPRLICHRPLIVSI